jgi:peptidoglycan/LPS O-acetylase OafA/YrhL
MSDQSLTPDGGTRASDRRILALDGLRFVAAFLVAGGHYMRFEGGPPLSQIIDTLTGLGMTLFFVLSGFVIHYNYNATVVRPGGLRSFFAARFARLYPLYIVLFLFDFAYTGLTHRSACALIGAPGEHWSALIYYLTLTQSWFYAVICQASLGYQYGPVAAVTWSISVEVFFYLVYIVVASLIARRRWSPRFVIGIAVAAYASTVVYFLLCGHYQDDIDRAGAAMFGPAASTANGYDNSLLRWLFYFNPAARLAEFLAGLAAAQLYLAPSQRAATLKPASASEYTLIAILAAILVHLWLYGIIAPNNAFIGRTAGRRRDVSDRALRHAVVAAVVSSTAGAVGRIELLDLHAARNRAVGVQTARPDDDGCRRRLGHLGGRAGAVGADQPRVLRPVRAPGAAVAAGATGAKGHGAGQLNSAVRPLASADR